MLWILFYILLFVTLCFNMIIPIFESSNLRAQKCFSIFQNHRISLLRLRPQIEFFVAGTTDRPPRTLSQTKRRAFTRHDGSQEKDERPRNPGKRRWRRHRRRIASSSTRSRLRSQKRVRQRLLLHRRTSPSGPDGRLQSSDGSRSPFQLSGAELLVGALSIHVPLVQEEGHFGSASSRQLR